MIRGIRGAICVKKNDEISILSAAEELLRAIMKANKIIAGDIAAVIFTSTEDLDAEFPAKAGRKIGLEYVPFLCTRELSVKGSMKKTIRALVLAQTSAEPRDVRHQYLGEARKLRPDLSGGMIR